MVVSAAEAESDPIAFEKQYPELKEVQEYLDADEILKANDLELSYGEKFDIQVDLSGIEGVEESKMKVLFHEAKSEAGTQFDIHTPDTYQAVYAVELTSGHPSYRISRNITVKESETAAKVTTAPVEATPGGQEETHGEDEEESYPEIPVKSEKELDAALNAAKGQETVDQETGLTFGEVMMQASEQGVDFTELEPGESLTFTARSKYLHSVRSSQRVTVEQGGCYYYADYGLGTYLTSPFTVTFGNVTATAYCIEPSKPGPGSGTYQITRLEGNKKLAKVCYYGSEAAGASAFFAKHHTDFSTGKRFIITHLAASYANGSSDAFYGTNSTGESLAKELYNYAVSQPDIPDVKMSFSNADVTAYVDGNIQRTEEITFRADKQQTITMKLPKGVKFHNLSTGKTSKAGAEVVVSGGTRFYLSAPLTQTEDVAGSWSSTMKGSITKDYSAYKITTGTANQDLALVFGEGVESRAHVDFSVKWLELAKVKVTKVDAKQEDATLSGAVFGIYKDKACSQLLVKMPATDENGESQVEIIKIQDVVYLKEITAPKGYRINSSAYNVKLVANQTTSVVAPDEEQMGELTIYKEGQVLIGAQISENATVFQYENRQQKGAVYHVYAGEDILSASGAKIYSKGDLVKENLLTDENGACVLKKLHLGTYKVKEMKAPENFYNAGEEKLVTLSYAGQNVEVVFSDVTFTNDRQKADVSVVKTDKDTEHPLAGGVFALYADSDISNADGTVVVPKGTLIEKVTAKADGTAGFTADLPIGYSYAVKEEQAPEGYLRNTEDVYSFRFSYTNDSEPKVSFSHTFVNERVSASIALEKKDAESKQVVAQGDATLEKAVYGLYARKDIVHPDGTTGVLFQAGEQVATLTTDKNGQALVGNLYLGEYYVKEIIPSAGYLVDEKEYDLICNYEGDLTAEVKRTCTSWEQVKKQPFQIIKAANNGETDAELLSGAGFSAYLESSLKKKADGRYDFDSATPVVIGENGATEMFTDEKGYACSTPLPYGTYIVRETTTPHNFKPVDDFVVRITENHPNTPQKWRVLLDKEFEAKLKIVKVDEETKKPVLQKGTEFKIYDLKRKKYVEQVTTYPTTVVHKSYFTDEQGYLILPQNLKMGKYRIEEVHAPNGYTLNENYYEVTIDSNTAYQMDGTSGDVVIEVVYENRPVKGKLTIVKSGEVLEGFKDDFTYHKENLKGATFEVYAAEDIYTPDRQKNENGNHVLEYAAGTLVQTVTTDTNGQAILENLPLGSYEIVEVIAPEGFVLTDKSQKVTLSYQDQETPVIEQTAEIEDERQKVEITVVKKDADHEIPVEGAEFGIYVKKDLEAKGKVIVEADTLLGTAISDADGQAVFAQDFPFGEYYIKELQAPKGYVSSDEVLEVKAEYQGQEVPVIRIASEFKNKPTKVVVSKSDLTTGVELSGATLTVLDKDGTVVDTWKSVKGEPHLIERLTMGETYTLREEMAPYGYLMAEEITFTLEDTEEIQKVEIKDDVPKGTILINKTGEFLEKVTPLDSVSGWISHLFQYMTGTLQDVTFEVYALEDIKAADGESEDYYKKEELVATITTDASGIAKVSDLPLGKYYVKEKATAEGFLLDDKAREVDLTYRNQNTAEVTYSSDWQNNRQKVEVKVLKKAKGSDRMLEGAVFALCAKEDITGADGKVLLKADTVIEELATDKEGRLTFTADLPIGFSYYVKETSPAPGFVTTDEVQEFTFDYKGADKEKVSYSFTFENEPTKVQISKTDIAGKELPGAKLTIFDKDGKVVESWTSGTESHYIEMLPIGEYTLHEESAPKGYLVAEDVKFEVKDTGEIQKVVMKDEAKPEETPEETPEPENPSGQDKNPPKTGDASPILPLALLAIASIAGIISAVWTARKKK